jgi:CRISPR-associated protein Cas2
VYLVVAFDLPTTTAAARKAASRFRNFLRSKGFERRQLSLYERKCDGALDALAGNIAGRLPVGGNLWMTSMTDEQYLRVARFRDGVPDRPEMPSALVIF